MTIDPALPLVMQLERQSDGAREGGGAPLGWFEQTFTDAISPSGNGSSAPGSSLPRSEPWPQRVVHVSAIASEARVWIRDARLPAQDEPRLAESLALELAQRGLRLRALSVNGLKVFEAALEPTEAHPHGDD